MNFSCLAVAEDIIEREEDGIKIHHAQWGRFTCVIPDPISCVTSITLSNTAGQKVRGSLIWPDDIDMIRTLDVS